MASVEAMATDAAALRPMVGERLEVLRGSGDWSTCEVFHFALEDMTMKKEGDGQYAQVREAAAFCSACGRAFDSEAAFCSGCGAWRASAAPAASGDGQKFKVPKGSVFVKFEGAPGMGMQSKYIPAADVDRSIRRPAAGRGSTATLGNVAGESVVAPIAGPPSTGGAGAGGVGGSCGTSHSFDSGSAGSTSLAGTTSGGHVLPSGFSAASSVSGSLGPSLTGALREDPRADLSLYTYPSRHACANAGVCGLSAAPGFKDCCKMCALHRTKKGPPGHSRDCCGKVLLGEKCGGAAGAGFGGGEGNSR